jgi:thymidylate synthase (FAD)
MTILEADYKVIYPETDMDWEDECIRIDTAARTCYQSEPHDNVPAFIRKLRRMEHTAMVEFGRMHVVFQVDRGVSHELVRHRLFSFAQESTRYCRYDNICFIRPSTWTQLTAEAREIWVEVCRHAEEAYKRLLNNGCSPQQARAVLPNSVKTQIHVAGDFTEWLHFFKLRDSSAAHPDMQAIVSRLHAYCIKKCPEVFEGNNG